MSVVADLKQDNSKYQDDLSKLKIGNVNTNSRIILILITLECSNNLNAYETLKIEKEKVEKINIQLTNSDSLRATENEGILAHSFYNDNYHYY